MELDSNGQLYKINSLNSIVTKNIIKKEDDAGYDKTAFEKMLEIKGDSDHTKLIDMLTDLNDYSIGIEDVLKEHFDEENIVYWMAFQILMGNDRHTEQKCLFIQSSEFRYLVLYCLG